MAKYVQTNEDLRNHLCEQVQFLAASAAAFDNGHEGEAKRLATTIRVLVHDTKSSRSLLRQLNMKHTIRTQNTAHPIDPRNAAPHQGLVVMRVDVPEGIGAAVTFTLLGEEEPYTDAPPDKPGQGDL